MNPRPLLRGAAGFALALAAVCACASGNDGAAGAETGDTAAYNTGKAVYSAKLACAGCPLSGKSLDAALARQVLAARPTGVALSADEGRALEVYLKRRFKL